MKRHTSYADRSLVFIGIETSGLNPDRHEITEIAAFRNGVWFHRRVRMLAPENADPKALELNGYDAALWEEDAIHPWKATAELNGFVQPGDMLVFHNSSFDLPFLRKAGFASAADYHPLDTASMAWPLVVAGKLKSIKLAALCDYFGVSNEGAHGARRDVERLMEVYLRLMSYKGVHREEVSARGV